MAEVEGPELRPDLVWDDQVRGLCVRVYSNGSQSFLFVYRVNDRQSVSLRYGRLRQPEKGRRSSAQLSMRATTQLANSIGTIPSKMSCDTSPSIGMNDGTLMLFSFENQLMPARRFPRRGRHLKVHAEYRQ
jgi:hypothetical protein